MVLAKCLLHRVQWSVRFREPLDGENIGAIELPGEHGARLHRLAVHVHHAGATLGGVAAHMGAGEPQMFAQNCTRSVRGSTSPVTALPFTVIATADMTSSSRSGQRPRSSRRQWMPTW